MRSTKGTVRRNGALCGGLEEIRTPDPRNANAMRSQLRYKPIYYYDFIIALQFLKSRRRKRQKKWK